ncbi:MAG: regulatory protein MerR [Labilithrix sp.]|nr:regulatory protein MerR [Labilithrix sp.]
MLVVAMRIGELAERAGVRPSAIRYYEEVGLLRRAPRVSGRRVYAEEDARRLRTVLAATRAGFSLAEIRRLVPALESGHRGAARWQALARAKVADLGAAIQELEAMRSRLHMALTCACGGDPELCVLAAPITRRRSPRGGQA